MDNLIAAFLSLVNTGLYLAIIYYCIPNWIIDMCGLSSLPSVSMRESDKDQTLHVLQLLQIHCQRTLVDLATLGPVQGEIDKTSDAFPSKAEEEAVKAELAHAVRQANGFVKSIKDDVAEALRLSSKLHKLVKSSPWLVPNDRISDMASFMREFDDDDDDDDEE